MKKVIFGGLVFIGGAVLYTVATLGTAGVGMNVSALLLPKYIGALSMLGGMILGILGLIDKN